VSPDFSQILLDVEDQVATITLNRSDRLNAFTPIMRRELVEALDMTDADDSIRVVIVTGAGRGFCAGADLGDATAPPFTYAGTDQQDGLSVPEEIGGIPRDGGGILALRLAASRKPVIGAINGPAVGVGATMTLPMDVRIASDQARFGFVFARRGIVPEAASSWFLPRVVGISQAAEWALTGRILDASEALAGRLVSRVVPGADLLSVARGIAAEIADHTSAVSVAATRRMLWSSLSESSPWRAHMTETLVIREMKRGGDPA
jgi:enoyl-CoA hydratase/carnithine racemase